MTINVELLRRTLEYITEHPEQHDQASWGRRTACGTAMCLAGWAGKLAGADLKWNGRHPGGDEYFLDEINGLLPSRGAAKLLFGDPYAEQEFMFDERHSLDNLWALAELYTNGEIKMPREVYEARDTRRTAIWEVVPPYWDKRVFPAGWQPAVAAEFTDATQ